MAAEQVVVPDVVGLTVADGQRRAGEAGVALAQPDPDGPPLSALTWPRPCVITGQSPAPGTRVGRWGSVVVTYADPGAPADVPAAEPPPPPGHLSAERRD